MAIQKTFFGHPDFTMVKVRLPQGHPTDVRSPETLNLFTKSILLSVMI